MIHKEAGERLKMTVHHVVDDLVNNTRQGGRCRCLTGVMKDKELHLEEIESSHTLGGSIIHT